MNQIEKAYGPNNSILDNCHVRVAFATNDERTAKRISEALGTKTELRAQKNYTGHRLAPWLSHMMVSRQETQRPLMTPGEVMQLPASDEIVMVSGAPPVQAKKIRYYKDRNFTRRIEEPASVVIASPDPCDDWSGLGQYPLGTNGRDLASAAHEDGGIERTPELAGFQAVKTPELELDAGVPEQDGADPAEACHLDTVRRAIALDLADPDTLPDF